MVLEILFALFSFSTFILVVLNLVSLFKMYRFKPKEHILDFEDKPVSIIVCAHNELANLEALLPRLLAQAYVNFEVVVVDDRSSDGTREFLIEEQKKHSTLKIVRVEWTPDHVNEKKYALTLGIKAASNELLVMTDADCEPVSYNWLKQMVGQFNGQTEFILGMSYYREYPGLLNMFIRYETLHTAMLYITMALSGIPYMGVGRNIGYRKSFFLSNKGFNKILKVTGGDDDLYVNRYSTSRNTVVVLHPESVVLSEPKRSLGEYISQKIRHISVSKMYKFKHKLLIGLISLSKISFWLVGLSLIILMHKIYWTTALFLFQLLLLLWVYDRFTKILKLKYEKWGYWLMDFIYIFYLIAFSLRAFTVKKVKWN